MLDYDFNLLAQIVGMKGEEASERTGGLALWHGRIICDRLDHSEISFVGGVIGEDIEDEFFLDSAPAICVCSLQNQNAKTENVMSHYDKIPQLLDNLITCSMAEAARRCGMTPQTAWNYIVRSKLGEPKLQEIEFCSVVAPFQVQYQNAKTLAAQQIEQNAIERARDGCWVDVFYQGVRMFERLKKPEYAEYDDEMIELILGKDRIDEAYELKPTKQWLKPSDALVIKVLESWNKKYRSHQQIDVNYGGVLRLEKPGEQTPKTIEHNASEVFEEDHADTEQRGGHLALAAPGTSRGASVSVPVGFVSATGERKELRADIAELKRQAEEPKRNGPAHCQHETAVEVFKPDATEQPDDQPIPTPADPLTRHPRAYWAPGATPKPRDPGLPRPPQPLNSAGLGPGRVPPGGFKVG